MPSSSRFPLLLTALLTAASAGPALATYYGDYAIFTRLETSPERAVDTVPTRLLFDTQSWYATSLEEPIVFRDGATIRIFVAGTALPPGCGWPYLVCYSPPPDLHRVVDLGLLPAGEYQLELYVGMPDPDGEPVRQHTAELTVVAGPVLESLPEKPVAGESAAIEVDFGPGYCPHVAPARIFGRRIELPVSFGDCGNVALRSSLPPLAAGLYQVELMADGEVYARREIEVISREPLLRDGRFEVAVEWSTAAGGQGPARLVQPPSADSALFYFFSPANWELMVKVLDGCAINGHFWVYSAASTDVGFSVVVKDLQTGLDFTFANQVGTPAGAINAIDAFTCP